MRDFTSTIYSVMGVIALVVLVFFSLFLTRAILRIVRARGAYKRHRYKMLRDGFICVKCGYNVRGCTDRCAECGWPLDQDPDESPR